MCDSFMSNTCIVSWKNVVTELFWLCVCVLVCVLICVCACVCVCMCMCLCLCSDPMEELHDSSPQTATNSAAELLKQGAGSALSGSVSHRELALDLFHTQVYDDVRVSVQTRADLGVCMCGCMYACVHIHVCVCAYRCLCVCV